MPWARTAICHGSRNSRCGDPPRINLFDIVAILITLSALFSDINHRYIAPLTTIGLMRAFPRVRPASSAS